MAGGVLKRRCRVATDSAVGGVEKRNDIEI